jgi:hypothetical protein
MLVELLVATTMALVTVVIHAVGLFGIGHLLRVHAGDQFGYHPLSPRGFGLTLAMVLLLFMVHGLEIWLYAVLFHAIGAIGTFRDAVYFSTTSYAAIGYSDAVMAEPWKLVGAIEGINGLLLLGWSTAFFVTVMSRFRR